jgi:HTH-type transcriptional regulator / antitoxin HipB
MAAILPLGNMKHTPKTIGELVKTTRKSMGVTQKDLAMTSGTGLRFIIELEQGKPTCQLGKALTVLQTLGVKIELVPPAGEERKGV